jgi:hypothetical protein
MIDGPFRRRRRQPPGPHQTMHGKAPSGTAAASGAPATSGASSAADPKAATGAAATKGTTGTTGAPVARPVEPTREQAGGTSGPQPRRGVKSTDAVIPRPMGGGPSFGAAPPRVDAGLGALAQAHDAELALVAEEAERALARVHKQQAVEVPVRVKLTSSRLRPPKAVPGVLVDKGEGERRKTTFYPADERFLPFDVDPDATRHIPRGAVILAHAQDRHLSVVDADGKEVQSQAYALGEPAARPSGSFIGVVDYVAGVPHLKDIARQPPAYVPLDLSSGDGAPLPEHSVVAAHAGKDGAVVIEETLAAGGSAAARAWIAAAREGYRPWFSARAVEEAKAAADTKGLDDPTLVDRTDMALFAIDGATTRDIDQVVGLERRPGGGFVLRYGLADLSAFIKPGSALFSEVLSRGASLYLPGLVLGTQPEVLTDAAALISNEERRALLFTIELDDSGDIVGFDYERARIKSRAQLDDRAVAAHLDRGAPLMADRDGRPVPDEVRDQLALLADFDLVLRKAAERRGALAEDKARGPSAAASQFSFIANQCAGLALAEPGAVSTPGIYRSRPPMPASKIAALRLQAASFVEEHAAEIRDVAQWRWRPDEPVASWYERLRQLPTTSAERGLASVLRAQLDAARPAVEFSRAPRPHDELKIGCYSRVTASLRESVSFLNQALLAARLTFKRCLAAHPELAAGDQALLMDHIVMAAVADPNRLPQPRAELVRAAGRLERTPDGALGAAVKKLVERLRAAPAPGPSEQRVVEEALDRGVAGLERAKGSIGRIAAAAERAAWDELFLSDLAGKADGDPSRPAPLRPGRIRRVSPSKIHIKLDFPELEVKIDVADLKASGGEAFTLREDGSALVAGERRFVLGALVQVRAVRHDGNRLLFTVVDDGSAGGTRG